MQIDHFNFKNDDSYLQRYILSASNWQSAGPIFFYTGNEGNFKIDYAFIMMLIFLFKGDIQWFCENTVSFVADLQQKLIIILGF